MPILKNKISYQLDLSKELEKIKGNKKKTEFKNEVRKFVENSIFDSTQASTSPVTGEEFRGLSKEYKKIKKKKGKGTSANLRLEEDMLPSLFSENKESSVVFKIVDWDEKKKAFNHNVGDTVPRRPFLPDDSKSTGKYAKFSPEIKAGIKEIASRFKDDGNKNNETT